MDFHKVSGKTCCPCNELCCAIKLDTFGSADIDRRAARAPDASMIQYIRPALTTGCNDDWSGDRINPVLLAFATFYYNRSICMRYARSAVPEPIIQGRDK